MDNIFGRVSPLAFRSLFILLPLLGALGSAGAQASEVGPRPWEPGRILELGAGQDGIGPWGNDGDEDEEAEDEGGRVLELGAGENGRVLELGAGEAGRLLEFGAGESGFVEALWGWFLDLYVS